MPENSELGLTLLQLARDAIGEELGLPARAFEHLPELLEPGATFVTLKLNGSLRGCIGSLVAYRALLDDVRENACQAAFADPRFAALAADELAAVRIEVSLLTAPSRLHFVNETDALAQFRPHIDGIVLNAGHRRATFLPQVWEDLPDPGLFLAHLKQKAGLPPDYWGPEIVLERYQVQKWKEAPN